MADVPGPKSYTQVSRRVSYLGQLNQPYMASRSNIRKLMNGGRGAIDVLLKGYKGDDDSLPAANAIKSGVERFADMISAPPDLRIEPPGVTDKDRQIRAAQKRERIVHSYDFACNLDRQLEQLALWLPGYGYGAWRICARKDSRGVMYPHAELRDPYTTLASEWGVDQEPHDIAFTRFVDPEVLVAQYPHAKAALEGQYKMGRAQGGAVDLSGWVAGRQRSSPGYYGQTGGVEVVEYVDKWGVYLYSPLVQNFLDVYEHPLPGELPVVMPRRVTFDDLTGQFDDVVGLASAMAKLTLLAQIVMEDAAFAPVIVNGRMDGPFRKGRDAINVIEGGDAKYLYQNVPYQMFQEIDRIERHLRTNTGYAKQADGESPISFVTGQGIAELGTSMSLQAQGYQSELRRQIESLDGKRLRWDERVGRSTPRLIEGTHRGEDYSEEYTPEKDIKGRYKTRRVYGIMAGLDEPRRMVGMLQLLGGNVIDVDTVRENLRDIENPSKVSDRITAQRAEDLMFQTLATLAQQGDPAALQAMIEVRKNPANLVKVLDDFFSMPEEAPPEEMQMGGGPEDEFAQVLSRLTADGAAQGGAQTVRQVG